VLTRALLAARKHVVTRSFVLDYRFNNLCLDLTWSSNHFCHLSHSCNANARLELWRLSNQPVWKVYTNCDIPSNHLISIDYRIHSLPRISPCVCNAPTCALTLPDPTLSTCSVINHTQSLQKQAQFSHSTITPGIGITQQLRRRATAPRRATNLSQPISRFFPPARDVSERPSQREHAPSDTLSTRATETSPSPGTTLGMKSANKNVALPTLEYLTTDRSFYIQGVNSTSDALRSDTAGIRTLPWPTQHQLT